MIGPVPLPAYPGLVERAFENFKKNLFRAVSELFEDLGAAAYLEYAVRDKLRRPMVDATAVSRQWEVGCSSCASRCAGVARGAESFEMRGACLHHPSDGPCRRS